MARFPASSGVRAVRYPTTVRAVRSLGGPRLPIGFAVVVEGDQVNFFGWRKQSPLWGLPVSSVESISVAETLSPLPWSQAALAIVLRVRTGIGFTELPIVPISDDGKRSLTWRDAEVRALAMRLSHAMTTGPGVGW